MSERATSLCGLMLVGLLLAGCSVQTTGQGNKQPQPPEEMAQGTTALTPVSSLDTPSGVTRSDNRVEISNPKTGTRWYIWSPDFSLLAYQMDSGIWAINPDGSVTQHLVKGPGKRDLVGWWDSGVVYLEYRTGEFIAAVARPNRQPEVVATIKNERCSNPECWVVRNFIFGDRLILYIEGHLPVRVDLRTGAVVELGDETGLASDSVGTLSPDGRYVWYVRRAERDKVRILDLDTGKVRRTVDELNVAIYWAPSENRWAALSVEPGFAGRKRYHLDVVDVEGNTRHLHPPQPLKLVDGPWWSPDGKQVAVLSEEKPASDPRAYDRVTAVWVVTLSTGEWRKVSTLPQYERPQVRGWHPDNQHLIIGAWWMPPKFGRLPIAGGDIEWLTVPTAEEAPTYLDERILVYANWPGPWGPTAYIDYDGKSIPVMAVHPTKEAFQLRGKYASWIEYVDGPNAKLVVTPIR